MADVVRGNRIFEKTLTASDVCPNQSRLIIPTDGATRMIDLLNELNEQVNPYNGTTVNFVDEAGNPWLFFFQQLSPRSYVLRQGWNNLVRLQNLQEGSRVAVNFCYRASKFYILVCPCICLGLNPGHVHGNPHFCYECGGRP